jgi:E3 ubiquitin-protein ligase synoviolin
MLLIVGSFLFGLQKLLYGPLRPIEVEQLYEKAWFAITETCLAMTIFREEVGAWFIVMFVSLLVAKVWGWIGEGRVEVLEQQPPPDPRLFHARLSSSLALSFLFTTYMLNYCITTVQQQARPNMMVMFAFEFAVLTVTSMSTCARYGLSLRESAVIRKQTAQKLAEQRTTILQTREAAKQRAQDNGEPVPDFPPVEEEINELDIDVPGWEDKGRWVFYLDLATDFLKLVLYLTFFCVLCIFYGMPIHIIRDVAITVRSFYNRVTDFIKYRHATRDMNERYPDATAEEIAREDTCIICREPMRPWQPPGAVQGEGPTPMEERLRPKKLPCGHILHFACLRSWLERQQKCPTCRQDVVGPAAATPNPAPRDDAAAAANEGNRPPEGRNGRPNNAPRRNRVRFFNLGPLRLGFGAGNDPQALQNEMINQRPRRQPRNETDRVNQGARPFGFDFGFGKQPPSPTSSRSTQLLRMERQLRQEINSLNLQQQQLRLIRQMQNEFFRLRARQAAVDRGDPDPRPLSPSHTAGAQGYSLSPQQTPLQSGDPNLPAGVTIPEGWQLTPLVPYAGPAAPGPFTNPFSSGMGGFPPMPSFPLPNNPNQSASQPSTSGQAQQRQSRHPTSAPPSNDTTSQTANNNVPDAIASMLSDLMPAAAPTHSGENGDLQSTDPSPSEQNPESSASTIPQWGSQRASPQHNGPPETNNSAHLGTSSSEEVQPNGEARSDKGKAKAATVEEAVDEGH